MRHFIREAYGMDIIPFGWGETEALGSELAKPITRLSIESTNGRLVYITFGDRI